MIRTTHCCRPVLSVLLAALLANCVISCNAGKPPTSSSDASPAEREITVSAAVSLRDAFQEIGRLYGSRHNARVNFNFGSSGVLQRQIENGSPADVFASAGARQMNELANKDLIDRDTRKDFASNTLVLITPGSSTLRVNSFADLNNPQAQRIAVGNAKTVPVGQYTEQSLTNLKLLPALQPKLISAEDVRQVLDYVVRGEADAGIVYASDAKSAGDAVRVVASAPESSHEPVLYPIAVVKDSRRKEAAEQFIDLVISAEGQAVLRKYGFSGVNER